MTSGQPRAMRVWPAGPTLPAQGSLAITDTANSPPLPQSIARRTGTKQPLPNILQLSAYMDAPLHARQRNIRHGRATPMVATCAPGNFGPGPDALSPARAGVWL